MPKTKKSLLKKFLPAVQENISLKDISTFRIGGKAKYFFLAENKDDLIKAVKVAKEIKIPFLILGEASNVLISDKPFKGLVIKIAFSGLKRSNSNILAFAGTPLQEVVNFAQKNSLSGLEWAVGIPGTIGGAVCTNAGAFTKSISKLVKEVEVLDIETLKVKKLSFKKCFFSNKDSIFKKRKGYIILSVLLKLKKGKKQEIKKTMERYLKYRKETQPLKGFSAGCIFKNLRKKVKRKKLLEQYPELKTFNKKGMIPAGFLIEKCGLKGVKEGKAQISKKHANFIVNLGGAKAKDVLRLIKKIKKEVKNKFGVLLEEEIEFINT